MGADEGIRMPIAPENDGDTWTCYECAKAAHCYLGDGYVWYAQIEGATLQTVANDVHYQPVIGHCHVCNQPRNFLVESSLLLAGEVNMDEDAFLRTLDRRER